MLLQALFVAIAVIEQSCQMPPRVMSFAFTLVFALKEVQSQAHVDGSLGLRREIPVQGNRVSYGNFAVDKFQRLQVSVGLSSVVSNYRECALSCVNNPPCSSFNVASSPRFDGKFRCELLNEDKYSASPGQLVSSVEYHHYSIKVFEKLVTIFNYPCPKYKLYSSFKFSND